MNKGKASKELPTRLLEEVDLQRGCVVRTLLGPYIGALESKPGNPGKVLFLRYEDLKEEALVQVRRLADFLGKPFTSEEDRDGLVEEMARLCSFENLSSLEVNKDGFEKFSPDIEIYKNIFFQKGQVRNWKNHLTEEMAQFVAEVNDTKLGGSGLSFGT